MSKKKKKKYRGRLVGFWAYDPDEEKLKAIRDELRTRNDGATLRELVRSYKLNGR